MAHAFGAEGPEEAVRLAAARKPDIVVLDLALARGLELDAARRLREDAGLKDIPVIVASAQVPGEPEAELRRAGCAAFVDRPIDVERFAAVVRRHAA